MPAGIPPQGSSENAIHRNAIFEAMREFEGYREARAEVEKPQSSLDIDAMIPHICSAVVRGVESDSEHPFEKTRELIEEETLTPKYKRALVCIATNFYTKIGRPDALKTVEKYCAEFLD